MSRRGTVPQGDSAARGRIEGRTLDVTDLPAIEAMVADLDPSVGVTSGDVNKRIGSAKLDPAFLMADVEVIATYELSIVIPNNNF